jgi:hypothetical protein
MYAVLRGPQSINLTFNLRYMNNNQHDPLFVFNLLSYHTSTDFGGVSSPSLGGRMYICGKDQPRGLVVGVSDY